jgi:hypothetical protein
VNSPLFTALIVFTAPFAPFAGDPGQDGEPLPSNTASVSTTTDPSSGTSAGQYPADPRRSAP